LSKAFDFKNNLWPPPDWNGDRRRFSAGEFLNKGTFRTVHLGHDTVTNQNVVAKKFTNSNPKEAIFWEEDLLAYATAKSIAIEFNKVLQTNKRVEFVQPIIDYCEAGIRLPFKVGECVLIEPYLGDGYIKYNSNSGWENTECGTTMGALSHFSYHHSQGKLLLCDLQGVKLSDKYVLTDPVMCSVDQKFGLADLGMQGISSFFALHHCTSLCRNDWIKASNPKKYHTVIKGTTFQF